jgi:hypothetical protein
MKLFKSIHNMSRMDKIITGVELLLILITLSFAIGYLVRYNVNSPSVADQTAYLKPIKVYAMSENPQFEVNPQEIGASSKDIGVEVRHSTGVPVDVTVNKTKKDNGNYGLTVERSENLRPGMYQLIVTGDEASIYKDFYWGVLAINTNKSVYMPNDEAFLQFGVLDQWGHTVCDSTLKLEVTDPNNKTKTIDVTNSPSCGRDNVVETADYYAYYKTGKAGTYTITLTNLNNNFVLATQFKVEENPLFSIERIGATRINPFKADSYLMTIKIKASQNFNGTVEEKVPTNFRIDGKEANKLSWNLNLSAGQEETLSYKYTSPSLSPQFYLIGPLRILANGTEIFRESRAWQIASDAARTSVRSGSWSADTTWTGSGPAPVAGDTVTITSNHAITVGAGASASSINFSQSGANLEVRAGFVLQLSSALVLNNIAAGSNWATLSGPGTINVPVAQVGNYTVVTGSTGLQNRLIFNVGTINISSELVITSHSGSNVARVSSAYADLQSGSINVGWIRTERVNTCARCSAGVTMNTGGQSAVLSISSASPWIFSVMTKRFTLTGTNAVINYNGTVYQTLPLSSVSPYTTMEINNSAGVALSSAVTTTNLRIGNNTDSSLFIDSGNPLTATGTLTFTSGSFQLGGAVATAWPGFATNTVSAGTTVEYKSAASQTVSTAPIYSTLVLSGAGTKTTGAGTLRIASNWDVNSTTTLLTNQTVVSCSGNVTGTGNITAGSGRVTINGDWTNTGVTSVHTSSVVVFTGTNTTILGNTGASSFVLRTLGINGTVTNDMRGENGIQVYTLSGPGTLTQGAGAYLRVYFGSLTVANLAADSVPNSVDIFNNGVAGQSFTGSYNFYNVSFQGQGASQTYTFTGNSITSVAPGGRIVLINDSLNRMYFRSSDANRWHLHVDPSATVNVSYADVQGSDASDYKAIDAYTYGNNVDSGSGALTNLNWLFSAPPLPMLNIDGVNLEGFDTN